jgi:hypothetical protein
LVLIRINVGGLAAQEICNLAIEIGRGEIDARVTTDIAGAQEVARGEADYYLGACATGGGGALSMAIAILGYSNCFMASTVGRPPNAQEIRAAVYDGKRAFGFTADHIKLVVPMIVEAVLAGNIPQGNELEAGKNSGKLETEGGVDDVVD